MTKLFICTQCGNCCRHLNGEHYDQRQPPFLLGNGPIVILSHPTLYLYDWEIQYFPKELVVPNQAVIDVKNKCIIVLSYTLTVNSCPHIQDNNLCGIYENRPIRCRSFPSPSFQIADGKPFLIGYQDHCTGEMPVEELHKELGFIPLQSTDDITQHFKARYGAMYDSYQGQWALAQHIAQFLKVLQKEGYLKLAKEIPFDIASWPQLPISKIYRESTGKELKNMI